MFFELRVASNAQKFPEVFLSRPLELAFVIDLDMEAGQRYLDSIGVKDPFPYIADDFDDPLPEDFLLRPLP